MPKKRILQGNGPDGCEFDVVEDKNGFIIKCGLKKRTSIRLSSNMTAAEINNDTVCIRIGSYFALKASAGTEMSADDEHARLPTPSIGGDSRAIVISRKTAEELAVEEGQSIAGDISAKRARDQRSSLFTYSSEELGSRAAINRDYHAERKNFEENNYLFGWILKFSGLTGILLMTL